MSNYMFYSVLEFWLGVGLAILSVLTVIIMAACLVRLINYLKIRRLDIVFCKECKHSHDFGVESGMCVCKRIFDSIEVKQKDDFCSYGERCDD